MEPLAPGQCAALSVVPDPGRFQELEDAMEVYRSQGIR